VDDENVTIAPQGMNLSYNATMLCEHVEQSSLSCATACCLRILQFLFEVLEQPAVVIALLLSVNAEM
jgi:hypothetical protein